jgi:uncharacterized membrane protein
MTVTIAVAAVLRLAGLGSGLWYDEIVTLVASARLPIARIVTDFKDVNVHPLYSILAHVSISTLGESAWAVRLPACLFGIASVWMAYVLGKRLVSRAEAWAGATVLATSYHHIWFSQNARGYTMIGFFTLASTYFLLQADERGRRRDYVIYALLCAAGVYTHVTMAFVVAGHAAVMLLGRMAKWRPAAGQPIQPLMWAWTGAALLSLAAYAPLLPSYFGHLTAAAPREAARVATTSWAVREAIRNLLSGAGVPAAIAGGIIAFLGGLNLWRRQPLAVALLMVPAVVTGATVVLLHQPLRPRFFFFLSGAAAIFVGRGLGLVSETAARRFGWRGGRAVATGLIGCTVLLVAASAAALPRNYRLPKQDFDGAMRFLGTEEASGARIAAAGPACWPVENYFVKSWPCLRSAAQLREWTAAAGDVRVLHTLGDYIEDPELRLDLQTNCGLVRSFPGTLGGGDMVVCDPRRRADR